MNFERDEAEQGPADTEELDAPDLAGDQPRIVGHDDHEEEDHNVGLNGRSSPEGGPIAQDDVSQLDSDSTIGRPGQAADLRHVEHTDSASVSAADDTPSLQNSPAPSIAVRPGLSSPRRSSLLPFDRRFQARRSLSGVSSLLSPSPQSPAFLNPHSRSSSLSTQALQDNEPESAEAPWEVVQWTRLKRITGESFSEAVKRKFGRITCMAVTSTIALGTSRGVVLVFDTGQQLKAVIGEGTKAVECGSVTAVAVSADFTTVAAGHANGSIFTWEITRPAKPFLLIPSSPVTEIRSSNRDGHVSGVAVLHLGFLGVRHTALVSADGRGMAFSHLATRGMGAIARTVKSTRILGRYPETDASNARPRKPSSVLGLAPLPMGTAEVGSDGMGLVAMLTPYLLVLVSTTPIAQTQHKRFRPKDVTPHSAMSGALAWYPAMRNESKTLGSGSDITLPKLAYSWSNALTVLEVIESKHDNSDSGAPPELHFSVLASWKSEEPLVAMQWLSRNILAALTVSQQLVILEHPPLRPTDSSDLLKKHIYHVDLFSSHLGHMVERLDDESGGMHGVVADAFYMSFRAYKGRLFLLGFNDVMIGALSNWSDRLLAMMKRGDYIGAIRLASLYYTGRTDVASIGLPTNATDRREIVGDRLLELMAASLKYAFGHNPDAVDRRASETQLFDLVTACFDACEALGNNEFLFEEIYSWFSQERRSSMFLDVLQGRIQSGQIVMVPAEVLKDLVNDFAGRNLHEHLEELLCRLDPTTMDFDQVTKLCKGHELFDALFYVWSQGINDFTTILGDLLDAVEREQVSDETEASSKIFTYLSYTLTGRVYPTGEDMAASRALKAKAEVYAFLFSGSRASEDGSRTRLHRLRQLLRLDTSAFMSMLNEAFEDSFLNGTDERMSEDELGYISDEQRFGLTLNRQYILSIMLEFMSGPDFKPGDIVFLDMFIARNLPKYPQYILLPGNILHKVLTELCQYLTEDTAEDCQLSVEYLLSSYHPPDLSSLIPSFLQARFFRVVKAIYRSEGQFENLLQICIEDGDVPDGMYKCISDCLRPGAPLSAEQTESFLRVLEQNLDYVLRANVNKAAVALDENAPYLHHKALKKLERDEHAQYLYLREVMEPASNDGRPRRKRDKSFGTFNEQYIKLLCDFDPHHVRTYIEKLDHGDLKLESVLPSLDASGMVDSAVVLMAREGQLRGAIDRLVQHLQTLGSALQSLIDKSEEAPDAANIAEAADDLVASLDKYTHVGIWLCQRHGKLTTNGTTNSTFTGKQVARPRGKVSRISSMHMELSPAESYWLELIDNVTQIVRSSGQILESQAKRQQRSSFDITSLQEALRSIVQSTFTALLRATTHDTPAPRFLPILRGFLNRASKSSPSLAHLREVLRAIFSAYAFEEGILGLANQLLDRDLFVEVEEVSERRKRGWRPLGLACGGCGKKLWGPGAGREIWDQWYKTQQNCAARLVKSGSGAVVDQDNGKGKARHQTKAPAQAQQQRQTNEEGLVDDVVVFACRHLFHKKCLRDLLGMADVAASQQKYTCPLEQ